MKLVETKCPNCGSSIEVEKRKKKVNCEYCGTSFVVDDDVIEVKHLMAGEISEEQEFINAETNLNKLKNYDEAYEIYLSLSKRYVDNPEIWIGLLRSITKDFTYKYGSTDFKKLYQSYWKSFCALADEKEKEKYEKKYKDYVDKVGGTSSNEGNDWEEEKCYLAVTALGGFLGIHKFIQGETGMGFLYMFTFGLFGIGWICDIVREYKKWPETPQRNVVKWGVFTVFMILAISEMTYSLIVPLIYILGGVLSLDVLWNKANVKKTSLRVAVPIILFFVALALGSSPVPESSYGTWVCQGGCDYEAIEFNSSKVKVFKNLNDKKHLNASARYYESKIYVTFDDGTDLVFSYDDSKKELCLMNNVDLCSIIYEKEEKVEEEKEETKEEKDNLES